MSSGLDDRPNAAIYTVEQLVKMASSGEIRIPHFQRDFRWQRQDVMRLFDSIVRGYPVGSLLLWRRSAPEQTIRLGALELDAPATSSARWVVDGQQRITSLVSALIPEAGRDPKFALAYHLRDETFVPTPAEEDPRIIPLPELFDLTRVLQWVQRNPETLEYVELANRVTQTLRQFQIPAYEVAQEDVKVLQDIFDRMNNYGKRLSRAEVFSALFAGAEDQQEGMALEKIAEHLDEELGFGSVDEDTVLSAVLARRGPDVQREIRNEFSERLQESRSGQTRRAVIHFPDESRDTAHREAEAAMRRAISFLQEEAGVPHVGMLPYRYLLVVLTRFFAHHPSPDPRSVRLLRRWFWRAALVGPEGFKGSTTGAVRFLVSAVKPGDLNDSLKGLLDLVNRPDTVLPNLQRFKSSEAATKMVLCSWWAAQPRSLDDGHVFTRSELSEVLLDRPTAIDAVRYVVPRRSVPADLRLWAANRTLLPSTEEGATTIEALVTHRPFKIGELEWEAALASHHLSPAMVAQVTAGRIRDFLEIRHLVLVDRLRKFLEEMCEWNFENTPSLVSLEVEDLVDDDDR